ncbi:MAG: DUF262 domain-containing protein [Alphaproteobacteria bacterium]|nr:DUF262 domain-containing protein [Alphaproteobacteria bacterium]
MAGAFGDTPLGLTSTILNLGAVLTRKQLKVPRYQRPYTWTEREVRELIQDLWRAYKRGATFYFIGQIVLVKNHGKLEVSDGQQRLATLTMLLAYVRDRIPGRSKQYQLLIMDGNTPRLLLREEDQNFYLGFVQETGHMMELARHAEIGVDSKDLIANAARTIESEMSKITEDRELDAFMSYIVRACTLNVVDADERGCAQTVFNTLNKRGSPLSGADIIKSDLLENSGLSNTEADAAARKWEQTEDLFERENFARLLYMMPFLLTGEPLLSPGDLASFRTAVERAGGVRAFLFEQLPRYAHALRAIYAGSIDVGPASAEVNRRVALMKQVEQWDWAPCAIAFLAENSSDPERARRFFQALDRLTFACELSVVENRDREARYANVIKYINDDKMLHTAEGKQRALLLTEAEQMKFFATLNRSRKRDRQRRLLLMRLEAAMPGGRIVSMTDDATVEHVLPKNGGPWWNERFPDPALRNELANLLGNLTLLSYDQNSGADNKPYPEKRKIYFDTKATIYTLTKDIAPIEDWSLHAIEERHERLVRILSEDWGLVRGG